MPDVTLYDDRRGLGTLASEWHEAVARTDEPRSLAGLAWYRMALDESPLDVEPRVLVVTEAESVLGIVPFVVERRPTRIGAAHVLRYPSDGTATRCELLGPHPGTALTFALRWLARRNDWDALRLDDPDRRPRTRTALRLARLKFSRMEIGTTSPLPAPRLFHDGESVPNTTADRYVVWRLRSPRSWLLARNAALGHWLHGDPLVLAGTQTEGRRATASR